jgi:acetoin utilization protein AcuB
MSVFYVNDPSRGIVTPLSDKFRIRQVLDPEKLNETQKTHSKIESNAHEYRQPQQDDELDRKNKQAASAYTETRDQESEHQFKDHAQTIMSTPVISVSDTTSLLDAWKLMRQHDINHLAITNESNHLAGLLSEKNMLPHIIEQSPKTLDELTLTLFCQGTLLSATPDTDLYELAQVMLENRLDGIVIIENNTLQGIITYSDIIKVLLRSRQLEIFA